MAEHNQGVGPTPTPARSRSVASGVLQSSDTVFNAAYDRVKSTADCATFLSKSRQFSAAVISLKVHPCFQKEGEEYKTFTIGCRVQGGEGVKIEPKFTFKDIETQCPGGSEKRFETSELMVKVDINELGMKNDELYGLLWNLGEPEVSAIDGVNYTRRAIGMTMDDLPRYVLTIRPLTRDGKPANGIFEFPNVQLISEGSSISLSTKGDNKSELMFNVLFDQASGSMGWIYTLA